ncbi:MAG: T9SS type A sorting domain-containing protein [Chlorobiota bacterium]|nr:MAG: T9SS type A sorting domain-containing protein [Chlorobiota bacterium]
MNLRRTILRVFAIALVCFAGVQGAFAQISSQFGIEIVPRFYRPMLGGTTLGRNDFKDLYSPTVSDADNGVAGPYNLGFSFDYNGQLYSQYFICVNGWITFAAQGAYLTYNPNSLFNNMRPNLTLAPYFGDHFLRTFGVDISDPAGRAYRPSLVRVVNMPSARVGGIQTEPDTVVIEWNNMNINFRFDPLNPNSPSTPLHQPQATSVGTFQCWIIQAPIDPVKNPKNSKQGDIEFHYGALGSAGIVKVSGTSVGIEDDPYQFGGFSTFINAVAFRETGLLDSAKFSRMLSNGTWPPSGNPGLCFRFSGRKVRGQGIWGDGDADVSQSDPRTPDYSCEGQRLYVSYKDVITILRHAAFGQGPDPNWDYTFGQNGYHGDVNHDGRFFYSSSNWNGTSDSIINGKIFRYIKYERSKTVDYNVPFSFDPTFERYLFDADEMDAALIMHYLAAKLPVLPWLPDTLPPFTGKVNPLNESNDINISSSLVNKGNTIDIPLTFNGFVNGSVGLLINVSNGSKIVDIKANDKINSGLVQVVNNDNTVALAAAGKFSPDEVIAILTVEAPESGEVIFNNVKINGKNLGVRKYSVNNGVTGELQLSLNLVPNPIFANNLAVINYNIPTNGNVKIEIFNNTGKLVNSLVDSEVKSGSYKVSWNTKDVNDNTIEAGSYYCKLTFDGNTKVMPIQIIK